LIMNARQAVATRAGAFAASGHGTSPAGGTPPDPPSEAHVHLSTRATSAGVSIVVADRGAGIATSDLSRVFDPYFTTKRGGTGLGLPIAKNIIEGLGGAISITSTPGFGTAMRIDLPLAFPGAAGAASVPPHLL
jgi:signal transduction histidine kinase